MNEYLSDISLDKLVVVIEIVFFTVFGGWSVFNHFTFFTNCHSGTETGGKSHFYTEAGIVLHVQKDPRW